MRDVIKPGLRLLLFTLVAALLLAGVNALTQGPIRQKEAEKKNASRSAVIGEAEFELQTLKDAEKYPEIEALYQAQKDGAPIGYVYELIGKGYGGNISLTLGISVSGAITGLSVNSHSETKGLGTGAEKPFLHSFPGLAADVEAVDGVDGMTGATVSTTGVKTAISAAVRYSTAELGIAGAADAHYTAAEDATEETAVILPEGARITRTVNAYQLLGDPAIDGIYEITLDGQAAYAFALTISTEYHGDAKLTLIISNMGVIQSLTVDEFEDTSEYSGQIHQAWYQEQFAGKTLSADMSAEVDAVTAPTEKKTQLDVHGLILDALRQCAEVYSTHLKGGAAT